MIVVSDTSPLNYLVLIGQENLLHELFGKVVIPQAVFDELGDEGAPAEVRAWSQNHPHWVEVKQSRLTADAALDILDPGEREAILLAQEISADLLLIDDRQARQVASEFGLAITGTVGVLDQAARAGLIDLKKTVAELRKTNFHIAENIVRKLLEDE